ncbi:hypothetical protein [Deinococcus cellulosilyticus]|uniref:Uncharacterized protein n=1 Tax=Deinococcus cellulosilyticus (strain DSM 18568 / NBRC 106333 / KACC 11606 / 5516J-15) TaxID=1223518 RepID=A0A511N9H3_DEIC1|nr:hypothetical protein [Deinococcus cellulosilyticus]GEM49450.1 hypothetical protein DC3_50850 [Deinococcus cellulosilyticus NBRC 106333 = KACC 11606]
MESQQWLLWPALFLVALCLFTQQVLNFALRVLKMAGEHGSKSFQYALGQLMQLLRTVVQHLLPSFLRSALSSQQDPHDPPV